MITSNQIDTARKEDYLPKGSPAQRFRNIMLSQPSKKEQEQFDKRMIEEIEDEAKAQIDESNYDLNTKPKKAVYESELRVMERINSVMPKKNPIDSEVPVENYPPLVFTNDGSMLPTAESVHERAEALKIKAFNLIGEACINGAKFPKFDYRTGKSLPFLSIPVLESAIESLGLNQQKDSPSQI